MKNAVSAKLRGKKTTNKECLCNDFHLSFLLLTANSRSEEMWLKISKRLPLQNLRLFYSLGILPLHILEPFQSTSKSLNCSFIFTFLFLGYILKEILTNTKKEINLVNRFLDAIQGEFKNWHSLGIHSECSPEIKK